MTTKAEARKRAAAVREGLSPEYMKKASEVISRKVLSLRRFKECGSLFIYVSVAGEPDTEEIIRAALDAGKRVFAPRCTGLGFMEAAEIADFDQRSCSRKIRNPGTCWRRGDSAGGYRLCGNTLRGGSL